MSTYPNPTGDAPESGVSERTHVPLGADVELYQTIGEWAPSIAGFLRFDLKFDSAGIGGAPGVELTTLQRGDAVLDSWLFVVEPFDVTTGAYVQGYLAVEGVPDYAQSFSVDSLSDWQGYGIAIEGEGLFGVSKPIVFEQSAKVSFYIGNQKEQDPGSTTGWVVLIVRVLPAPLAYPATAT